MIKIKIPNNNISERKYILDIIFEEFLGLNYELIIDNEDLKIEDWIIELENGKILIIKDTFFSKYPKDLEYLKVENIPKKIEELDIFAASFFMLTRWEEYVNKNRDSHNRFPAYESLAYKQGFLDRPIVNEYVEWLHNELSILDNSLVFKKRKFKFILTHDVDISYKYYNLKAGLKEIITDLIKRKNLNLFLHNLFKKITTHLKLIKDPFDTYDYLMDMSENIGVKSHFFLHSSNSAKEDINNDKFIQQIANKIKRRGHFIGYHPSYNAFNNYDLFIKDKKNIERIIEEKLKIGRGHFLRFEVPTTWQIWEDANMQWDSTLSYADKEGFRVGVCYEYNVFNILSRKKLNLKEKPLIVMEGSFTTYQLNITPKEMHNKLVNLISTIKKYNGEFVFLWHNSSFNVGFWDKYKYIYEGVVNNDNTLLN